MNIVLRPPTQVQHRLSSTSSAQFARSGGYGTPELLDMSVFLVCVCVDVRAL